MLINNNVELPPVGRKKLAAIESARADAEDAAQAAVRRLSSLDQRSVDPAMIEELVEKRDRHQQRHAALSQLVNKIGQWKRGLPVGTLLEPALSVSIKIDGTIPEAIAEARNQSLAAKQHLAVVRDAELPKADLKALAAAYVQRLGRRGAPDLNVDAGKLTVAWDQQGADSWSTRADLAAMIAWAAPELMTAALQREIEAQPEPEPEHPTMTAKEKATRIGELSARLDELERIEEALIENAQAQGFEAARRADASPAAVLGVRVVTKAAASPARAA